jgi:hypothetical protein
MMVDCQRSQAHGGLDAALGDEAAGKVTEEASDAIGQQHQRDCLDIENGYLLQEWAHIGEAGEVPRNHEEQGRKPDPQ